MCVAKVFAQKEAKFIGTKHIWQAKAFATINNSSDMRFFINGYYGFSNLGDEALLWTLLRALQFHAGGTSEFLIRSGKMLPLPEELSGACRLIDNKLFPLLKAAAEADLTIFGGGSQFQDHGHLSSLRYFIKPWLLAIAARHVSAIGVSIGPLGTVPGKFLAHGLLRRMDSVLTRDIDSFNSAHQIDCKVLNASDICFADYLQWTVPRALPEQSCLGISLLPWALLLHKSKIADHAWLSVWADALHKLAQSHPELGFLGAPFQRDVDNSVIERVFIKIGNDRCREATLNQGPEHALSELSGCSHFVAMRFHALVFAVLLGKPTLILDYHPKVRLLAEELGFPPQAILSPAQWLDQEHVATSLEGLINQPENYLPTADIQSLRLRTRQQLDFAVSQCLKKV